jgi:hypothetical protein
VTSLPALTLGIYGALVPRAVRDAVRFVLRPAYRHGVLSRKKRERHARLRAVWEPRLRELSGGVVMSGPFAGLKYPERSVGSAWAPKILGTYEIELAPIIEEIISRRYRSLVDIGAAEGYYALGLAKRMPDARVICFEAEEKARGLLERFASENDVASRVEIRGLATKEALARALVDGRETVVICDIEGGEVGLLDPAHTPALLLADILVELHDFVYPDVEPVLRYRFVGTHEITEVVARPRLLSDWKPMVSFERAASLALLDEQRPTGMRWFWMRRLEPPVLTVTPEGR